MKKTLFAAALISAVFIACDKESKKEMDVKKLPSKIVYSGTIRTNCEYIYDAQYRLVKIIRGTTGMLEITYNSDNTPTKMQNLYNTDIIFQNNGNQIIIFKDTLCLNDEGQLVKYLNGTGSFIDFTYNSDGNIVKWSSPVREMIITYSDVPAIFRHVNTPQWFLFWLYTHTLIYPDNASKYMPSQYDEGNKAVYELDTDNYVTKMKTVNENDSVINFVEYEYILVN